MDKQYFGTRLTSGCVVTVVEDGRGRDLDPQLGVRNHSPTGFEWGYAGSGPAQLSLAICIDVLGDVARARRVYQAFKFLVVAHFARDEWSLTAADAAATIATIEQTVADRANAPAGSIPF
jgi:hypothetical protein